HSHAARGGAHGFDDFRMLTHAEVIVRAPDDDIPHAVWAIPNGVGKLPGPALQIDEHAIALLALESADGVFETADIVEHDRNPRESNLAMCAHWRIGLASRRPRRLARALW